MLHDKDSIFPCFIIANINIKCKKMLNYQKIPTKPKKQGRDLKLNNTQITNLK